MRIELDQRIEIGREVEPAIVWRPAGNEGAPALLGLQEALGAQEFDRLANRHSCDAEFLLQFLERGNSLAFDPAGRIDALTHDRGDLKIERDAAAVV